MYPGFVLIRYDKMTERRATAFERRVYYSQFLRGWKAWHATHCHIGSLTGRSRERGTWTKPLLLWWQEVAKWRCPLLGRNPNTNVEGLWMEGL